LMKVLPIWIDRGAPISDTHSNRIIGKGINYSKTVYKDSDGTEYPAIMVTGKIHKNYELDNDIWSKIKSGEYKGLSFGGATKSDREPMRMKDGSIAYSLKDLEHYEVAVCRDPAVPLALITEYNTLAKSAVDGVDLGGGRMLIKCDKYGCYVNKENREAGLKAPEARNEALVYDDKTHDQPSETPEENQAKIQKDTTGMKTGHQKDCPYCAAQEKDMATMTPRKGRLADVSATHDAFHKEKAEDCKYCNAEVRGDAMEYSGADADKHEKEHKDAKTGKVRSDISDRIMFNDAKARQGPVDEDWLKSLKKPNKVKKGEDWSNADGDRQSSMFNQNTDEGGMGKHKQKGCKCGDPKCKDPKCKKHKREVRTGYGAEENDTGEVGWQGSGSPYPKKKAIMSNLNSRLKLMLVKGKKVRAQRRRGRVLARQEMERRQRIIDQEKRAKIQAGETEFTPPGQIDVNEKKLYSGSRSIVNTPSRTLESLYPDLKARDQAKKLKEEMEAALHGTKEVKEDIKEATDKKKKKKDVEKSAEDCFLCGQKHTHGTSEGEFDSTICDSCVNHLAAGEGRKISGPTKIDDEGHEVFKQPPKVEWKKGRKDDEAELIANDLRRSGHPKFKTPKKTKKSAIITNIHSRLKSLEFMLKPCHMPHEGKCNDMIEAEKKKKKRIKKEVGASDRVHQAEQKELDLAMNVVPGQTDVQNTRRRFNVGYGQARFGKDKADGEFGGMNTGEVEWTEPRDTANSRTKRGKDVA